MSTNTRTLQPDAVMLATNGVGISKTKAAQIVGGRYRLEALCDAGAVRVTYKATGVGAASPRWECNLYDVLCYARAKAEAWTR